MSSPRVLFVTPSLELGGAERVIVHLARGVAAQGVETVLVAIDGSGPLRAEVHRPDRAGQRPAITFVDLEHGRVRRASVALVRTIRAHRPDVVVSSQTHLSALLVLMRGLLRGARVVAREPMLWSGGPRESLAVRAIRRTTQRRADTVIASSEAMRARLEQHLGRPVATLPNPVDVDALRAQADDAVRVAGPGRRLVFLGRLAPGKGLEDLLEAFAAAASADDLLTIVGDGPLRGDVERTIDRLGIAERVVLTGPVNGPAPLLAAADALVLPSRSEGMPNAALEALAVGTPILATTDLDTLAALSEEVGPASLRLVPRADLGSALAATMPIGPGPRPSLLPEHHRHDRVAAQLLALAGMTERRLRILLPILAPYPSTSASTVQSVNMAQAFAELGHEVRLVAANRDAEVATVEGASDPAALYGFPVAFRADTLSGRPRRGQSYRNAPRLTARVLRWRPDLILSRDLRGCLIPALAGVPTVYEVHSLSTFDGRQDRWVLRRLQRARGFRGFVAISQALADDLVSQFGVEPGRILVAHDAVRPLRTQTGTPSDDGPDRTARLRVGYTGSLFAGRGIELLAELASSTPWIELHLIGGPPDAAEDWRRRLSATVGDRIVVHGMVSPARARALQQQADVLVAPFARRVGTDSGVDTSRWMSPMKVFEYMASGRPIVISDLPVLREVLRPEVDALMVPPEDPDALLGALERLRDDPALGARLAASALERVRTEFTWNLRARRILERFGA